MDGKKDPSNKDDLKTSGLPLLGGGDMGELIRNYDWSKNSLGHIHTWSVSLRTLVNMMLASRFPMLIFWGPDLITFYNDAFRPSLGDNGKHPTSLGQPGPQSWAESWPVIGPMIYSIMAGGEAVWFEDQKLPLYRDGQMSYAYWTYSFSPVTDDTGAVNGILVTCSETTKAVESLQELNEVNTELRQLLVQNTALQNKTVESEAFARNLFYSSPVANLVFVGEQMVIQMINEGMLALLGRDQSIVGQPFLVAMPELVDTPLMDRLRQVLATGQTFHQPEERIELIRYGQPYIGYYQYIYTALRDEAGQPNGVVVTAIEVTSQALARQKVVDSEGQYRRLSEELDQQVQHRTQELTSSNDELAATNEELTAAGEELAVANQWLEETNLHLTRSNQNLEQFAYIASHDLQEPLRKIQQFGDLLKTRYAESIGDELNYVNRMQVAASRMSLLIKDLLSFSRISTSQAVQAPVALDKVLNEVLDTLSVIVEETGAVIEVDSLPVVQGDISQLTQLFQNLLSNALKFSRQDETGKIITPAIQISAQKVTAAELPVSLRPTRQTAVYHLISVRDNGIGFEEKYADRIFQVFQRLHGKNEFAGTGIGLAIVQKVVTNHGGAITATSKPGEGAVFSVYLPA